LLGRQARVVHIPQVRQQRPDVAADLCP
jgi:hypothetical protein